MLITLLDLNKYLWLSESVRLSPVLAGHFEPASLTAFCTLHNDHALPSLLP